MIRCLACGAETSNGLALCELCQHQAGLCLQYLPVYYRNLARWRPGRTTARQVPGSRVLYDGTLARIGSGDRILDRLEAAVEDLLGLADVIAKARPYLARLLSRLKTAREAGRVDDADTVAWLCTGFARHLTSIATLDCAGEFVHAIANLETVLRWETERAIPGWYAGGCRRCSTPVHVVPGLTWVTCTVCGTSTAARDHVEVILSEARGWVARPMRLAEAVVALVDTETSIPRLYERIKKWEQRGRLTPVRWTVRDYAYDVNLDRMTVTETPAGPKRYRLGDVLDLVYAEARHRALNGAAS